MSIFFSILLSFENDCIAQLVSFSEVLLSVLKHRTSLLVV
uniref:Uncharacterized protein n=1 Tax=Anguilla anguilla TaxID=7936 RepID=A0A0E9RQ22_ANGAN